MNSCQGQNVTDTLQNRKDHPGANHRQPLASHIVIRFTPGYLTQSISRLQVGSAQRDTLYNNLTCKTTLIIQASAFGFGSEFQRVRVSCQASPQRLLRYSVRRVTIFLRPSSTSACPDLPKLLILNEAAKNNQPRSVVQFGEPGSSGQMPR